MQLFEGIFSSIFRAISKKSEKIIVNSCIPFAVKGRDFSESYKSMRKILEILLLKKRC